MTPGKPVIEHRYQCTRCGEISREPSRRDLGAGKCRWTPKDPYHRGYHDWVNVRVQVTLLDDVVRPEFKKVAA